MGTPTEQAIVEAFTAGFQFALGEGGRTLRESIFQQAIAEVLAQLEPTIVKRLEEAQVAQARDLVALQAKRQEFMEKLTQTKDPKYEYYLHALNWMLSPNGH